MASIEVDFEVYKQLTLRRETEAMTYNDVVRKLLGLSGAPNTHAKQSNADAWIAKGVVFPPGTEFRANYKGMTYLPKVEGGVLKLNGMPFNSPSMAAMHITKYPVNGWRFWECRRPGESGWTLIERLRN